MTVEKIKVESNDILRFSVTVIKVSTRASKLRKSSLLSKNRLKHLLWRFFHGNLVASKKRGKKIDFTFKN